MERREHDIMMDMIANQGMSFDNLVTVGLNANNTSLQDRSTYENNDWVREHFKDQYGEFDKQGFDAFYNNAKVYYNQLASANYEESMKRQATFHRDNIFAPVEKRREGPEYVEFQMANPYQTTFGVSELGRAGARTKSIDELAQSNKVLLNPTTAGPNLENAQWGDTPNDSFWGYFTDTLVMAQYDTDGTHLDPFTGEQVEHKAGDLKLDNTGNFYYEKLDGRDIYGRRVLNKMNVLTTDGSFWNKYDFFDSDDINQKSIGGTVLKNLALVGTMFIPYVGPWITGLSIATQLAGLAGTLGKMVGGSDAPTWSALEGWSKSVSRQGAQSEYAQEHTWCWENFINLIGDVAGQLKEQRFIFEKVPYVFKGANMMTKEGQAAKLAQFRETQKKLTDIKLGELRRAGVTDIPLVRATAELRTAEALKAQAQLDSFIKGYNKIGEIFSKGYMTAITVGDTYGEAKAAGASDLDATLLTLGYAAGEYAILNTGLGEWILPELRAGRYKSQAIARTLTRLDDEAKQSAFQTARQQLASLTTKEGKKEYVKKLFNIGRGLAHDVYTAEKATGARTLSATFASAMGEGVEEVSEGVLADFSKGCFDVVKWLQGEDTRLNSFGYDFEKQQWNGKEVLDRYGMSLVGGFIGGGLTNAFTNYKAISSYDKITNKQAIEELVYMARNGGLNDFMKQVNKMQLGDQNLSTDFEIQGTDLVFSPGTKENNQDTAIKTVIQNQVNMIQGLLSANGAVSDSQFLDAQTLGDLRFAALRKSTTAGMYLQTYNSLLADLFSLRQDINTLIDSSLDSNKDGVVTDREERKNKLPDDKKSALKKLESEFKEKQKQLQDLISGKSAVDFISTALFETTSALSSQFGVATTFPLFAEQYYGRKYSELTENDKAAALEKYKQWKSTEGRERIHLMAQIYKDFTQQTSRVIKQHEQTYLQTSPELLELNSVISQIYPSSQEIDENLFLQLAQNASDSNMAEIGSNLVRILGTEQDAADLRAILERLNSIDPQATQEEREAQKNEVVKDYANKVDDILANNITAFVQPFIDRGFINAETKDQLSKLLLLAHTRVQSKASMFEDDKWSMYEGMSSNEIMNLPNPYEALANDILISIRAIDSLSATPIEKNLNEFSISIGQEPINLTQLIERVNASFNDASSDLTKFNLDSELAKDLNNAIYTMQLYKAAILGARTDSANLSNIFGYNATLNEVASKVEGAEQLQLAEIDSHTADLFIADIDTNLNKLTFLKRLYDINQGQKLSKQDRVSTKKDILIYKRLKNIVSILDDDPLKDWDGILDLQAAINGMTLHEQFLQNGNTVLDDNQKQSFEAENLLVENAIYDFFQKNKDKLNDPQRLSEFINPGRFQLYTEAKELLNEGLDNLDDNSLVWWIASRAALRSQDFYNQYRQIINPEGSLAPIATQELAIYNNYASIINGNVFSAFYNAYRLAAVQDWKSKSVEDRKTVLRSLGKSEQEVNDLAQDDLSDYAINFVTAPRYQNIILTEGIPGSGKSTGVFQSTLQLLKTFYPQLLQSVAVIHGANADSAMSLRDSIGLTDQNSKTYGREQWMKVINPNWREYSRDERNNTLRVPTSDYTISTENEIKSKLGVADTSNPPSLIIIDEISKLSAYDLDQIDTFAKKYGITVLAAGDFDQSGVVGEHSVRLPGVQRELGWQVGLSRTNFIRSPKLGVSMRTDNSIKTDNLQRLQAYMQDPKGNATFNYFQDETGLYGDKVYSYDKAETASGFLDEILADVQNLIETLEEGQKIGYIYNSKTSPVYAALSRDEYRPFIDFREGGSAQGLEGQYYIIEPDSSVTRQEYLRDIYTGISRAQQGSILIAPIDPDSDASNIKFVSDQVGEKIDENLGQTSISQFAQKRKQILDAIASEGSVPEFVPRTSQVAQPTEAPAAVQPTPQGGLEPGVDPTPTQPEVVTEQIETQPQIEEPIPESDTVGGSPVALSYLLEGGIGTIQNAGYFLHAVAAAYPAITSQIEQIRDSIPSDVLGMPPTDYVNSNHESIQQIRDLINSTYTDSSTFDTLLQNASGFILADGRVVEQQLEQLQLKSEQEPVEQEQVETLIYEDDIAPITQTDVINEQVYQQQIDESSSEPTTPQSTAIVNPESISIDMLLHTFNTFELGVGVDQNGRPIGERMDQRIDSVNGLVKVDKSLNRTVRTVWEYAQILGRLRSILFNTEDKSKIQERIQNLLGLSEIYCTFALKSSPRPGEQNRAEGREFVSTTPNPFDKGISEQTVYNGSKDSRSHEWHPKSIVVIIGTKSNGNLLELPLIALSSPFTLLQTKDSNGEQVFGEMYNRFDQLSKQGLSLYKISETLVSEFGNNPKYKELVDLFKLYNFTDAGVFYIRDKQWTPAKDLHLLGPQFITNAGYYQQVDGLSMNNRTNPESEWVSVSDFSRDPQCYVTKKVLVSMDGQIDGKEVVHAGHPFVLVSYNRDLNTDEKVIAQFAKQQSDPSAKPMVKLMYVLPPKASIDEYLNNLSKIIRGESGAEYIGNLFTSYNLLRTLMQSDAFRAKLDSNLGEGSSQVAAELLAQVDQLPTTTQKKDKLYEAYATSTSLGKQKIAGLLDGMLFNVAYKRNSISNSNSPATIEVDTDGIALINQLLSQAGIDGVYYKVKVSQDATSRGPFVVPMQGDNYTINGRPFRIHGKLDSYTFRGNMGWLVDYAMSRLRPGNNGHMFSVDSASYFDWSSGTIGNSSLDNPPVRSRQLSEQERLANNAIQQVKSKLGIDVSSFFEGKPLQQAYKQVIETINSSDTKAIAFSIGNELFISQQSPELGQAYLYDQNQNLITDLSQLADSNGNYSFVLSTVQDGQTITRDAVFNSTTKELEVTEQIEQISSQPTISITPENFEQYIESARVLLEDMTSWDMELQAVLGATTYEQFLAELDQMAYFEGGLRVDSLNELTPQDDLQRQIIADLIAIEESHDPFKENVEQQNEICPRIIKIKF